MNPLRPSPGLLAKLARHIVATEDAQVRAWVHAMRRTGAQRDFAWRVAGDVAVLTLRSPHRADVVAKIDAADLPAVLRWRWAFSGVHGHLHRPGGGCMASFLLGRCHARAVYRNGNKLDCRRRNLKAGRFPNVSIVPRLCDGKDTGYQVWRHFEKDPRRHKARIWFGVRRWAEGGKRGRALQVATAAAACLSAMTATELREWWDEYCAARKAGRSVENLWRATPRHEDGFDFTDLQQISHAFAAA